ncbi:hypothetical protein [Acetobacter senegalensis]|uniref:hypothetical protein n=1 Tax=Acetobacter senegalensis TaxID=446692 RepID=UPI001ED9CA34|nr:hypothetical protein [Acetobacter senegalensis]MCG4258241.1 hypothetical protein [Acetobacter senegalensis]MCG4268168.1 hypothetical protein [Acetobacter senegalensis]
MKSYNPTRTPAAPACQPDGVRGATCSRTPKQPKLSMQAKLHTRTALGRVLWIARFHPVWMWDFSRAVADDAGAYLDRFRVMQWFMRPYRTWVKEQVDWLHEARQKEWEDQRRISRALVRSADEEHSLSGLKQQTSITATEGNSAAPLPPEGACALPAEHASVPPATNAELPCSHRSGASSSLATCLDTGSPESSFHGVCNPMMDVAGGGSNATACNAAECR